MKNSLPLINTLKDKLQHNQAINLNLNNTGYLRAERLLPFMCISRVDSSNDYIQKLLSSEPVSLLDQRTSSLHKTSINSLIKELSSEAISTFSAFLLLELEFSAALSNSYYEKDLPPPPEFIIQVPSFTLPAQPLQTLEKNLKKITLNRQKGSVKVDYVEQLSQLTAYCTKRQLVSGHFFYIKLVVSNIYHNPITNHFYPLVFRKLKKQLSTVLKKTFYDFSQTETTYSIPNYQALGRRATLKTVWHVDKKLAEISSMFDFLYQVTPINSTQAFRRFKVSHFSKTPQFLYHPLPIDPTILKRQLFMIPVDKVEDPTLYTLFLNKQKEMDNQLSMLSNMGTSKFLYGSIVHYGTVNDALLDFSKEILTSISPHKKEQTTPCYSIKEITQIAKARLSHYQNILPDFKATIKIRKDIEGLMVSNGQLLLGCNLNVPEHRVEALIQHEIGTHILTYLNGSKQPLTILQYGLDNYDELQEGLAVIAEFLVGGLSPLRLRLLAARVLAGKCLTDGASFIDTYQRLHKTYGFAQKQAFMITLRLYRGGGYVKDIIYLRGLEKIINYFQNNNNLELLYIGKFGFSHIPLIKELVFRKILKEPLLLPSYLNNITQPQYKAVFAKSATFKDFLKHIK